MKCLVCRFGEIEPGITTYNLNGEAMTLVVKEVPADVCDACGEGYLAPEVSERLNDIVEDAKRTGVEFMVRKYTRAEIPREKVHTEPVYTVESKDQCTIDIGIREKEFISKLGLEAGQYVIKESSGARGYELDAVLSSGKTLRFGSVRFNIGGQDPRKLTVYAVKGFHDPDRRFKCQKSTPTHCLYKFYPEDEDATEYAARVVKSAYESKL